MFQWFDDLKWIKYSNFKLEQFTFEGMKSIFQYLTSGNWGHCL